MTGARFGPHSERRRKRDEADDPTGPIPVVHADDNDREPPASEPAIGLTGARFGPLSERRRRREDDPLPLPPEPEPRRPRPEQVRAEPLPLESEVLIRPYAITGGRTRPRHDLALESLISTTPRAARSTTLHRSWEHRRIASLCVHPRSVAEVAALLAIPLGVARILLGDMATDGTVVVHGGSGSRAPDLVLMNRVLAGLRRL